MITSTLIQGTDPEAPEVVFTASTMTAITTIILCNTEDPNITDETAGSALVDIHLAKSGQARTATNKIVNKLFIPAGETVFFNDERIILDETDQIYVGSTLAGKISVTVSSLPV